MKFDEGKVLLLLSGILTGVVITSFIFSTSFKQTKFITYNEYKNMSNEVNSLKLEIKGLTNDYEMLTKKLRKYKSADNKDKSINDTIKKELDEVKLFYGLTPVKGPGIIVIIDDRHFSLGDNDEDLLMRITHNYDLLSMVNELRNAGAEAIAINGERITANTAITCEGPITMINNRYVVPPFEITAIGNPDAFEYSLSVNESYYNYLKDVRRLKVSYEKKDKIIIPEAYFGTSYKEERLQ